MGSTPVSIQDFAFSPQTVNVSEGTTVCWTNTGSASHTVTSDTPLFDSGTIAPGGIYEFTFTTAGS